MVKKPREKKFDYPVATIRIRQFGVWKEKGMSEIKDKVRYLIKIDANHTETSFSCNKNEVWKRIRETTYL